MSEQKMIRMAVLGATSAIAKECILAQGPILERLAICGRSQDGLAALEGHLRAAWPSMAIKSWVHDLGETSGAEAIWEEMALFCERVDQVVLAPGILGSQEAMEAQPLSAEELLRVNCVGPTIWALLAAGFLERQGSGALGIITSVAGMRGRASNYIYGSSKAQLIALAQGLRCRLSAAGARVIDFRPGMVDTPMTAGMRKGPLMASAPDVGAALAKAMQGADGVVYSSRRWQAIMAVIKMIPFAIFRRMKI